MCLESAGQAVEFGYKNVGVMLAGEPAWVEAEHPTYANFGFVCQGNRVLVDLRSTSKDEKSRIYRSVSMPFASLEDTIDTIPLKASVVLYSDNEEETFAALQIFQDRGYEKVSLVEGGYSGWRRMGGRIDDGPAVTEVQWKKLLLEGEVALAEFNLALTDSEKAVILDVRTNDEAASGKLKQAHHIPLNELCGRMDEFAAAVGGLTPEQKIYIHCTTGIRAEMAYNELIYKGYNAYFLVADVVCAGNDCDITE